MKQSAQSRVIAALMLSTAVLCPLFAESAIEASRRMLKIESVADMADGEPYGPDDEHFWGIVRLGRAAISDF